MIKGLIRLMRLYYSLPLAGGFVVILAYLTGGNLKSISGKTMLSFGSLFCVISAGYVLNDICDIVVDRINCPLRPLAHGKVNIKTAMVLAVILFAAAIVLAWHCTPMFFAGITMLAVMLVLYDFLSKRIGIFKDILVAFLTTSLYPLAFTVTGASDSLRVNVLYILPVWLFFTAMGYEMLKDVRDTIGDRVIDGRALNNLSTKTWFLPAARIIIITASLTATLPFFLGYCKWVYLLASSVSVILAIVAAFKKPAVAIRYVYAEIFLITFGSILDLVVFGP
ncbi:MAG: hypothetical protein FVQ79_11130 [Planctomycetes bacterium]|nr:hypothetical protein [Planctomycetota bacterium]